MGDTHAQLLLELLDSYDLKVRNAAPSHEDGDPLEIVVTSYNA